MTVGELTHSQGKRARHSTVTTNGFSAAVTPEPAQFSRASTYEDGRDGESPGHRAPSHASSSDSEETGSHDVPHTNISAREMENQPADHAIIEEVVCVNFMCHGHLEVKLGPLINFIIGHNGSGKSAVLTAITLCLGGKATATNRGQSLKTFIKEGEE